ncbi:peptidoglycan editing factor PgeF [Paenibacillus agricola]|uniref:Purine nucleoside phosphorylase n=1 Tax=Paenibacillus agricola TaxID=2716264 RepID=A0ABX0IXH8_9BACL|nr:peptidoglycan editing factor PgeF [Paenibacillus agricola]NHN28640.1 peptidoglycan editing factor PgeF [Paenibacillus agricola]
MEPFVSEKADNGCELLIINSWMERDSSLTAGFTSRHGGVSQEAFGSLNCGLHVDDVPAHVISNRQLLANSLNVHLQQCTYGEQVHGNEVQKVVKLHAGAGTDSRDDAIQAKDAFITNEPGLFLHVLFADCVPLYFYDPVKRVVGIAHAGWKGTALQIALETLKAMQREYGTKAKDVLAVIGPSIQACCYEVNDTVVSRFCETMEEMGILNEAAEGTPPIYESTSNGKYNLNLQQMNRQIMMKAGIMPAHIEMSSLCTSCRTDLFFSHRKELGKTGRMAAWIGFYE